MFDMSNFNMIFSVMFTIVPIFILIVFAITFGLILSPKLRGKFMSRQVKATKYMLDESVGDLTDISNKSAKIREQGIEMTMRAVKRGLEDETVYCKHCGASIDADSKFCKACGKEL